MTTLIASEDACAEATSSPGGPRLRVRRAGRAEQTVSVVDGKCTIGSSPRCHVCLPAAEAKPLQCLVSLEAGVALATRWTAGVLLNGREFTRRPLHRGDRLSIGPWELVWEAPDSTVEEPPARPDTSSESCRGSVTPTPPPLDATAVPSIESPAPPVEANVDLVPPSVPVTRPAAKTMLVASRPTELFVQPKTPSAATAAVGGPTLTTAPHASQLFQDRLVVGLWKTAQISRSRAQSLLVAARASRERARELANAVADLEARLSTTRATGEAQTASLEAQLNELRTELQSAMADRKRATDLAAEVTELEQQLGMARAAAEAGGGSHSAQLQELRTELDAATADRKRADALAAELAELEHGLASSWANLDAQAATHESQLRELRTQRDAATVESAVARQRAEELAAAVTELELQLTTSAAAAEAAASYSAQLQELQTELDVATADRKRAVELAAEVADLEHRLASTCANFEAQAAAHEAQLRELQTELDAATADQKRTAELAAAATDLERQLATARAASEADAATQLAQIEELSTKLAQAETERDRMAAELEAVRTARPKTAPPDPRLQSLSDACDAAQRKVVDLRSQLAERDELITELRSQEAEAEAARAELEQKLAAQQLQQSQWLAECQTLQRDHATALAEVVAERDELQRHVDKLAAAPAQAVSSAPAWPVVADELTSTVSERAEASEFTSPICTEWASEDAASASAAREETPPPAAYAAAPTELSPAISAAPEPASPIAPAPAEREFAPASFIDKYRHMLEEDDAEPATPLRNSRPILDDEYLSPAKFDDAPGADDDSDEALEAYMSNMMRRVRGDGHAAPASQAPEFQVESLPQTTTAAEIVAAPPTEVAQVELDDNGMQRLARKQPISTNLAALRDLANASARGAIAHHRKRRHVESAITRGGFCAVAGGTAGYLMLTAPDANSPWFWCGCAALLGAAVSGAQFLSACWQRLKDRRSNGGPKGSTTAVDPFAALAVSPNDASPGGD